MFSKQISTEIEIEGSAEAVWAVLSDLALYAEWNPLIRSATGLLQEHEQLQLFICTPGLASRNVPVKVMKIEPNRELRWLGRFLVPWLLDGDHSLQLSSAAPNRVRVVHHERFSGLLVPVAVPWLIPNMTKGFEAMNLALKQRVEMAPGESAA